VAKEANDMNVDCVKCKKPISLKPEEITRGSHYQTTCPHCGQEQAGALYLVTEPASEEHLLPVVLK
jgi:DNA-directed RNA polymerase subunit RPC12/RpoP